MPDARQPGVGAGGQTSTIPPKGGQAGSTAGNSSAKSGCSCTLGAGSNGLPGSAVFALFLAATALRRRRR